MFKFSCPHCRVGLKAPEGKAGSLLTCPKCHQRLTVPACPPVEMALFDERDPKEHVQTPDPSLRKAGRSVRGSDGAGSDSAPVNRIPVWGWVAGGSLVLALLCVVLVVALGGRERPAQGSGGVASRKDQEEKGGDLKQWLVGTWEAVEDGLTRELKIHQAGHYSLKIRSRTRGNLGTVSGKWFIRGELLTLTVDVSFVEEIASGSSQDYEIVGPTQTKFILRDMNTGQGTIFQRQGTSSQRPKDRNRLLHTLEGATGKIQQVAFQLGEPFYVVASWGTSGPKPSYRCKVWNAERGTECRTIDIKKGFRLPSNAFNRDAIWAVSIGYDSTKKRQMFEIHDISVLGGGSLKEVCGPAVFLVGGVAFSWEKNLLVSAEALPPGPEGGKSFITVWDTLNIRQPRDISGVLKSGGQAAFSYDGTLLAIHGWQGEAVILQTEGYREVARFRAKKITKLLFSPDNSAVIFGNGDAVEIWGIAEARKLATLSGHDSPFKSIAVSQNGKRIAGGSANGTVKIWDAATGSAVLSLEACGPKGDGVTGIDLSSDGRRLVSGDYTGKVKVWDVAD